MPRAVVALFNPADLSTPFTPAGAERGAERLYLAHAVA